MYWELENNPYVLIVSTRTVLSCCLGVLEGTGVSYITMSVFNRNKYQKAIPIRPIYITDTDNDYILLEIIHEYQIGFERHIDTNDEYESSRNI